MGAVVDPTGAPARDHRPSHPASAATTVSCMTAVENPGADELDEPDEPTGATGPTAADVRVTDVLDRGIRQGALVVGRVRDRLPAPVPVYVGLAALAVTGVLSWPTAVAAGCGFAAFRHWEPRPSGMPPETPQAQR